ncbi:hypothetical protein ACP4OV_025308 [Aristida adscensionis]
MDPSAAGGGGGGDLRRRAQQSLSVAEKLLVARDLEGCKLFASEALGADPHIPGAADLHAAASALHAAQQRRLPNGRPDPYAVLGIDPAAPAARHPEAVHSHYRRLSLLLNRSHSDRLCAVAFTDAARLVAEAWAFLSNPALKSALDADLDAAAAAARAYQFAASNRPQPQPQPPSPLPPRAAPPSATPPLRPPSPLVSPPPRATPPSATPPPRATPPPAASYPRATPQPAAPYPRPTPQPATPPPRQTPPSPAPPPQPTPQPAAPPPRPTPQRRTPPRAAPPPRPTPPPVTPPARPTPAPPAVQTPPAAVVAPLESRAPPSSTFWTVCTACRHIHQYDRRYETQKLLCPSCRHPFVAEAMAELPPIVPGTDMYYCTWGFFPVGFPGCPGFERLVNSQLQEQNKLNAPWLTGTGGGKGNAGDNAENGVPVSAAAAVEVVPVEVPATTPPAKPMRVKVGAKKRGRPKGSKNKNKKKL